MIHMLKFVPYALAAALAISPLSAQDCRLFAVAVEGRTGYNMSAGTELPEGRAPRKIMACTYADAAAERLRMRCWKTPHGSMDEAISAWGAVAEGVDSRQPDCESMYISGNALEADSNGNVTFRREAHADSGGEATSNAGENPCPFDDYKTTIRDVMHNMDITVLDSMVEDSE